MKSTTFRAVSILAVLLSLSIFPLEALGEDQPAGLAPRIASCEIAGGDTPTSNPEAAPLNLGILGAWSSPRLKMTCQYGAFCPSTYCTSLRPLCNPGKYTETFMGKCCATPSDSSYARFVCVNNGQTTIDQYCRY